MLKQIAERTGGRVLTPADIELFAPARTPRESTKPVFDWFLLLLACLVPIDVGLRRVQLDWSVIAGWFGIGSRRESTPTMGALLERKKQVTAASAPAERPKPIVMPPSAPIPTAKRETEKPKTPPPPGPTQPAADADDQSLSTTERLLRRKRKRQEEQE